MKKIVCFFLRLFFLIFLSAIIFPSYTSYAGVINATSCSQTDVQAAIDIASSGNTVLIPAGSATWSTRVTVAREQVIIGAGIGQTIITATVGTAFYINIDKKPFRCSGIEFYGSNNSTGLEIHGSPQNFRIDHNKFKECRTRAIMFYEGNQFGVIDHNVFVNNGTSDIAIYGDNDSTWARPVGTGGPDFVFIEDNTFDYTGNGQDPEHAIASNTGAKYVFRYNMINSIYRSDYHFAAPIDAHGYCNYKRGTFAYEVYENTINSEHSYRGMNFRGGTGVVFNNALTGEFTWPIHMTEYRAWSSCGGTGVDPDSCEEGYPCKDQINALYFWNNTYNSTTIIPAVDDRGLNLEYIKENRDYFLYEKPGYKPYQYPHPLVTEQDGLGIKDQKRINQFKVYPNPVENYLNIEFYLPTTCFKSILLYDISGRLIRSITNKTFSQGKHLVKTDILDIKPGIYFIRFNSTNINLTYKIIK